MSTRIIRMCVALLVFSVAVRAQPQLKLVDPLEPLFPDSNKTERFDRSYQAHFPSGTEADVHVLLNVLPGKSTFFYTNWFSLGQMEEKHSHDGAKNGTLCWTAMPG